MLKTIEYVNREKSHWGEGPWLNEPDKKQWLDKDTDLPCLIHRSSSGALCGYVGVDKTHPLFKHEYSGLDIDVHGGLTYSEFCQETEDPSFGICHLVSEGEEDERWWFGFDCGHGGDLMPGFKADMEKIQNNPEYPFPKRTWSAFDGEYRNIEYVTKEIQSLAKQLKAMENNHA